MLSQWKHYGFIMPDSTPSLLFTVRQGQCYKIAQNLTSARTRGFVVYPAGGTGVRLYQKTNTNLNQT